MKQIAFLVVVLQEIMHTGMLAFYKVQMNEYNKDFLIL